MTLRQLQYFLEIAQFRSFTRPSEVLHVAQSALSRQIRALEEELGVPLFNRFDRGVTLTEAGAALRERAGALVNGFDQLRDEVAASAERPRGHLHLGLPPSLREMINIPLIHEYARRYDRVKLHVHEGISLDLGQLVQDGRLDCALIIDLEPTGSICAEPMLSEQLFLVGPRSAGLRRSVPVSPADVASRDLILTTRPNSLRLIVEKALANAGRPYRIAADFNATGLMVELVKREMAFSVLPYSACWALLRDGELSVAPIVDVGIDWVLISPRERGLSLAGKKLRALIREIAQQRIDSSEWIGARIKADT